jgi:hypothetical protein
MNSKLERMENKAIMAQLELLFQHFPEGEKSTRKFTQDGQPLHSELNREFSGLILSSP